jgi:hypothetical protein
LSADSPTFFLFLYSLLSLPSKTSSNILYVMVVLGFLYGAFPVSFFSVTFWEVRVVWTPRLKATSSKTLHSRAFQRIFLQSYIVDRS